MVRKALNERHAWFVNTSVKFYSADWLVPVVSISKNWFGKISCQKQKTTVLASKVYADIINKSGSARSISFFFFFVNKLLNNSLLMGQDSGVFNICVQLAVSCASKPQLICVEIWQALNFSKQLIL